MDKGKKVIGYTRVSTKGQADEGASLEAQAEKIKQYCALYGHELIAIYTDAGVSGKSLNRTGLKQAMDQIEKGQIFMFYSLSRLTRKSRDLFKIVDDFDSAGVHMVSINEFIDTTSAAGRMFFGILGVLNQFESEQVSERTKAVLQLKRDKGEILGSPKFGYRIGEDKKTFVEVEGEQKTIRIIIDLKAREFTLQEIADQLNGDGILTRRGLQWKFQYIHKILKAA